MSKSKGTINIFRKNVCRSCKDSFKEGDLVDLIILTDNTYHLECPHCISPLTDEEKEASVDYAYTTVTVHIEEEEQ